LTESIFTLHRTELNVSGDAARVYRYLWHEGRITQRIDLLASISYLGPASER